MSDQSQNNIFATMSGTGPCWAALAQRPLRGSSSSAWSTEPPFAEMVGDPVFQQLMASDRVSMECFNGLVSVVRQKLAG